MNQRFAITVRGKSGAIYSFPFEGDPKYLDEWREEGFEIDEVLNTIPVWAVNLGLLRPWIAVQDLWRWIRLW